MVYVTVSEIRKHYKISVTTLRNWSNQGKLECVRLAGGKRLYLKSQLESILGVPETPEPESTRRKIIYARVSSQHQKADLKRQIEDLKQHYPDHIVIRDIGSGLNWKRQGLLSLLEQCYEGTVSEIVIAYKDRLCRFGLELLEWLFQKYKVRLTIHSQLETTQTETNELAEDLLAVANFFVARNNGQRASEKKRKRKEKEQGTEKGLQTQGGTSIQVSETQADT